MSDWNEYTTYHEKQVTIPAGGTEAIVFDPEFAEAPTVTVWLTGKNKGKGAPYVSDLTTKGCKVGIWTPDLTPESFEATVIAGKPGAYVIKGLIGK